MSNNLEMDISLRMRKYNKSEAFQLRALTPDRFQFLPSIEKITQLD